jgi:hypothetical protein
VDRIVQHAQSWNTSVGITGALVYSGPHFAQILEGPAVQLSALMGRIKLDARHRDATIIKSGSLSERKFAAWHMAYSGQSTYVDRHIRSLYVVSEQRRRDEIRRLEGLIYELTTFSQ